MIEETQETQSDPEGVGAVSSASTAMITDDAACIGCGYNLRELSMGGLCPECGMAIEKSLHGRLLRFALPEYAHRVARGIALAYRSVSWLILLAIMAFLALMATLIWDFAGMTGPMGADESIRTAIVRAFGLQL